MIDMCPLAFPHGASRPLAHPLRRPLSLTYSCPLYATGLPGRVLGRAGEYGKTVRQSTNGMRLTMALYVFMMGGRLCNT